MRQQIRLSEVYYLLLFYGKWERNYLPQQKYFPSLVQIPFLVLIILVFLFGNP